MGALDNITMEELHDVREQTDRKLPRERVLAAIGRKQGDGVKTLAERHGVAENTIRNWLDRFEEEMVEQAPYDELCPGPPRNSKTVNANGCSNSYGTPTELGYEQQTWTPTLLLHFVKEEYGVEYSKRHARKLLIATNASRCGRRAE